MSCVIKADISSAWCWIHCERTLLGTSIIGFKFAAWATDIILGCLSQVMSLVSERQSKLYWKFSEEESKSINQEIQSDWFRHDRVLLYEITSWISKTNARWIQEPDDKDEIKYKDVCSQLETVSEKTRRRIVAGRKTESGYSMMTWILLAKGWWWKHWKVLNNQAPKRMKAMLTYFNVWQ